MYFFSFLTLENHRKCFVAVQHVTYFCADLSSFSEMTYLLEWLSCAFSSLLRERLCQLVPAVRCHLWGLPVCRDSECGQQGDCSAGTTELIIFFYAAPLPS